MFCFEPEQRCFLWRHSEGWFNLGLNIENPKSNLPMGWNGSNKSWKIHEGNHGGNQLPLVNKTSNMEGWQTIMGQGVSEKVNLFTIFFQPQTLNIVGNIYLHFPLNMNIFHLSCREIYHTWSVWEQTLEFTVMMTLTYFLLNCCWNPVVLLMVVLTHDFGGWN